MIIHKFGDYSMRGIIRVWAGKEEFKGCSVGKYPPFVPERV